MSGVIDTERIYQTRPPWGYDAHSALRWAFNLMDRDPISPNLMARMRTGSKPKLELSPLELRAQAAIIRSCTERIDAVAGAFIVAYYLPRPAFERQPGGEPRQMVDRWFDERNPAIDALAWWLMGQAGTGMHRIRGYRELVAQEVYGLRSTDRVKGQMKCGREKAKEMCDASHIKMKDLKARAITLAQGRLEQDGIL